MAKTIIHNTFFSIYTVIIGLILLSCSNEIPYGKTAIKHPISLTLNWDNLITNGNPPDSIYFLFYSTSSSRVYKFASHKNELHKSLPPGDYQVLVFNYNVKSLEFRNMDKYETAEVALVNQTKTEDIMPEPDLLYGTNIDHFVVGVNNHVPQKVTPQKLVQNISFKIAVDKIANIKECNGTISGVSSALNLSKNTVVTQAPSCTTPINTVHTGEKIIANVLVLGIQPKEENQPDIQNIVQLNFTLHDGSTASAEIDLTEKMQQVDNNDVDIEIEAHINQDGSITLTASVSVWEESGNTNVEIH